MGKVSFAKHKLIMLFGIECGKTLRRSNNANACFARRKYRDNSLGIQEE